MTVKTKYVDVVFGFGESHRYMSGGELEDVVHIKPEVTLVKDIGIDAQTGWLLVYFHDGDTHAFNTICPWKICTHDDGIVVPDIITDVS